VVELEVTTFTNLVRAREQASPFGTTRRDRLTVPVNPVPAATGATVIVTGGALVPSARVTVVGLADIVKSPAAMTGVISTAATIMPSKINGTNRTIERFLN
jgi:hypothetical protein